MDYDAAYFLKGMISSFVILSTIHHLDMIMSRLLAFDKGWKISDILAAFCCPPSLVNCGCFPYFWLIGSGAGPLNKI